jgi:hypothetical protein
MDVGDKRVDDIAEKVEVDEVILIPRNGRICPDAELLEFGPNNSVVEASEVPTFDEEGSHRNQK